MIFVSLPENLCHVQNFLNTILHISNQSLASYKLAGKMTTSTETRQWISLWNWRSTFDCKYDYFHGKSKYSSL